MGHCVAESFDNDNTKRDSEASCSPSDELVGATEFEDEYEGNATKVPPVESIPCCSSFSSSWW